MRGTYHCNDYCKCDIQTSARIFIKYEGTDHCKYNNEDGDETNNYINHASLKHITKGPNHKPHSKTLNLSTGFRQQTLDRHQRLTIIL